MLEVLEPGSGRSATEGKILVKLTETQRAYRKGEELILDACTAVPVAQELPLMPGQYFRRISTDYEWVKKEPKQ